jgi:ABC-type branched-subunit amino acid transport system ATPase component
VCHSEPCETLVLCGLLYPVALTAAYAIAMPTAHHPGAVPFSRPSRAPVFDQGRIIASGAPAVVMRESAAIAAYLGDEALS